jgi:methyl-accepting chemotaxis protein
MRIVTTLRGRLIAMVAALVAVTIGTTAIISTRVAHYEIRKFDVELHAGRRPLMTNAIADYYRTHRTWTGVGPAVEAMSRASGYDVVLFDKDSRLAATSPALRGASLDLAADGTLTITRTIAGGRTHELIRGPQMTVRDPNGAVAGSIFLLPPHRDALPAPTRSLDRSFFWTFLGATLFGILMAIAIARWISIPVERLTAAARRMESGDLAVRVEPAGGAELAELARGFNAMAAALGRNEEQRKRMVSDVDHELRAPL